MLSKFFYPRSQPNAIRHRHPETHMCPTSPVQPKLTSSLKPHHFPAKPKTPLRKAPTDPKKFAQWQKMDLMKMRHRAAPGDPKDKGTSPPPIERIHVKILTEQDERIFWFHKVRLSRSTQCKWSKSSKTIITGRALDLLVAQLRLSFPANQVRVHHIYPPVQDFTDRIVPK